MHKPIRCYQCSAKSNTLLSIIIAKAQFAANFSLNLFCTITLHFRIYALRRIMYKLY